MVVERPMSFATTASLPRTVVGSLMLATNRRSDISFPSMRDPMQIGVYQISLDSLGLPSLVAGSMPSLAGRVVPTSAKPAATEDDSLFIVLNPGMEERTIRLSGVFTRETAHGTWTATSPLGGGGTFTLRRTAASTAPAALATD